MLTAVFIQTFTMNGKESNSCTNSNDNEYQLQSAKLPIMTEIPITFDAPTDKDTRVSCEKHPLGVYQLESPFVGTFISPAQRAEKISSSTNIETDHPFPIWAITPHYVLGRFNTISSLRIDHV